MASFCPFCYAQAMEMKFDIQEDIARGLKHLATLNPDQIPKIVSHAINKTLVTVRAKERQEIERVFDRPTRWTLNAFFTVPAKPTYAVAEIRLKDKAAKSVPAAAYLAPEVYGGERALKGFERMLQRNGVMPAGTYAMPTKDCPLDAYGNIPRSYIVQLVSYLQAFGEQGYTANRNAKGGRPTKKRFYSVSGLNDRDKRGLPLGIYERRGGESSMVIAFVSSTPSYTQRFDFFGIAEQTVKRFLEKDVRETAEEAVRKANADALSGMASTLAALLNK